MDLGAARERFDTDPDAARALVAEAHEEAKAALREIRDLVRGIHPVILEDRGLDAALSAVVARSPVPVAPRRRTSAERHSPAVESAAYFVVSEALANVARHAHADKAHVGIVRSRRPPHHRGARRRRRRRRPDRRHRPRRASPTGWSGMGGTMDLLSPAGGPTTLLVELPCAS